MFFIRDGGPRQPAPVQKRGPERKPAGLKSRSDERSAARHGKPVIAPSRSARVGDLPLSRSISRFALHLALPLGTGVRPSGQRRKANREIIRNVTAGSPADQRQPDRITAKLRHRPVLGDHRAPRGFYVGALDVFRSASRQPSTAPPSVDAAARDRCGNTGRSLDQGFRAALNR